MAAAWTQKAGEGLAIVKLGGYENNRYWDNGSHRRRSPSYRKLELNPYVEYGVTDRATVGANAFLLRVEQEGGGNNSGVSGRRAIRPLSPAHGRLGQLVRASAFKNSRWL